MPTPTPHQLFEMASRQQQSGRLGEAEALYRKSLDLDPNQPAACNNLGNVLYNRGEVAEAINSYQNAVSLRPDFIEAWANLAGALKRHGDFDEAVLAAGRALALKPNFAEVHLSLGDALYSLGRLEDAVTAFRQALAWRSNFPQARVSLGVALFNQRHIDEAIAEYRKALQLRPDYALAHFNLGMALLQKGDFAEGLKEWEWRWKAVELGVPRRDFPQPRWDGGDLAGRRILIHAEQGIGDSIQFARYVPLVAERGGKVVLYCQTELRRLFGGLKGVEQIPAPGDDIGNVDVHCPLLSLPLAMGTTLQTIPAATPYISPHPALTAAWRKRLPADGRLKIGLAWAGRPQNTKNSTRSMSLAALAPLAQVPNATFYSLQKGPAAAEAQSPPRGLTLVDWTAELNDFADTAALMASLDVIIAVDTAVAHLAGALGRRLCVLLSFTADWRWFLNRTDSPWYPAARLFRQPQPDDWDTPIQDLLHALNAFAKR